MNYLICLEAEWQPSKVIFCNPDPTRTQALAMDLTPELLAASRVDGYGFIRKIISIDDLAVVDLRCVYAS